MGADRIDWIFDGDETASLAERYDTWAATYDTDHDKWGWRGPELVAAATLRHLGKHAEAATIVDAGCGTGKVGIALRAAGWRGRVIGVDLSHGMLGQAAKSGAYNELIQCSVYDLPLPRSQVAATVSSGMFTLGHVGGEAFAELCRITQPQGIVVTTMRLDLAGDFAPHIDALCADGDWEEVERTTPERLHPDRDDDNEQTVITWRVRNVISPGDITFR